MKREIEISLRNLIADAFCKVVEFDVMLVRRVSIRSKELRSLILLTNLLFFPYDDTRLITINGLKIKIFSQTLCLQKMESEKVNVTDSTKKVKIGIVR